jgi:hypothetical protein
MAITNVEVRHRCGCVRSYPLEMPAAMRESVAAQMRERDCGCGDCPLAGKRLVAARAPGNVNGHEAEGPLPEVTR